MAWFTVRVELRGATHGDRDYDALHKRMELAHYQRTWPYGGEVSNLPPAEYVTQAAMDVGSVAKDALRIAKSAEGASFSGKVVVLATQHAGFALIGDPEPARIVWHVIADGPMYPGGMPGVVGVKCGIVTAVKYAKRSLPAAHDAKNKTGQGAVCSVCEIACA